LKKPIALIIMDGYGCSNLTQGNAISSAKVPNLEKITKSYPNTLIKASGLDVGLPDGQMGNSEVGHTNIGAGRIVYQDLTRITKSIKDGDFYENDVLLKAINNAKDKSLHIMGLLSDGGVHSHIDHLKALIKMAKKNNLENVYVHAFTDGRDTDPQSSIKYVQEIEEHMKEVGVGKIATISGRYYAMDRDKRWERIQLAYDVMINGKGNTCISAVDAVKKSYDEGKNDEFILPTVVIENGKPLGSIKENDSIIFFNFRPDRARQITRALVCDEFVGFERPCMKTFFACMTEYDITIPNVEIAFCPQSLKNTLGEYLSNNNKTQLRVAETEKYAHVTFFFNGGLEEPHNGEDRMLIPSPKVETYDLQPEMSAYELTDKLLEKIDEDKYDFIVVNYANPDMVGHTGVFDAAVKAVETVDTCVEKVVGKILSKGGKAILTADHGNAEEMEDIKTNRVITAHSINPVPFIVVGDDIKDIKLKDDGRLCDMAPTILDLMGLEKPEEMSGHSLIVR
jgi:2,3-bisphosphoglycerate-independent phosphoglycerate mutase